VASQPQPTDTHDTPLENTDDREPYVAPELEPFAPPSDVSFGTNVNPLTATVIVG
jgi:hypothetical protein